MKSVFSLADENRPVAGCTLSAAYYSANGYYISIFSLAENTDITPEIYSYPKLIYCLWGSMTVTGGEEFCVSAGQLCKTYVNIPCGCKTDRGCIYIEITLKENNDMNEILKNKNLFNLKDLLPYENGKIVNMDLIKNENMKLALMSFTAGTGLPQHAAPGEALIFALDGNGIIGYEGKEYPIKAGENFKFEKGGAHYVKANENFKMALLLTLN